VTPFLFMSIGNKIATAAAPPRDDEQGGDCAPSAGGDIAPLFVMDYVVSIFS
jgi:hypothetical protein